MCVYILSLDNHRSDKRKYRDCKEQPLIICKCKFHNIILCLVIGNSIGISSVVLLAKKFKLIDVPKEISNRQIIGVSFLAGIGFTMAIFIASLAFENNPTYIDSAKIGILIGSLISAIIGYTVLRWKTDKITIANNV